LTKRFPVIAQAVSALDDVFLDGEIVALDEHGHPRFEWLVNRGKQKGILVYYVFLGDKDLRSEPPAKKPPAKNSSRRTTPSATLTT
jgi:ATP-dependent DNA ligase